MLGSYTQVVKDITWPKWNKSKLCILLNNNIWYLNIKLNIEEGNAHIYTMPVPKNDQGIYTIWSCDIDYKTTIGKEIS